MRGVRVSVLLILLVGSLLLAFMASYIVVVSQNPHASSQPLYGPRDYVSQPK
jgi:hypothetical protein